MDRCCGVSHYHLGVGLSFDNPPPPPPPQKLVHAQRELHFHYLFAEDHLVIKEEEDTLLASSIRLVDPGHLSCVDQFRTAV